MSSLDEPLPLSSTAAEVLPAERAAVGPRWWDRLEAWLLRTSELLNPIVVKEARQALKSRQFTITFTLVLAAGWLWSILGLAILGPSAYYSTHGKEMFFGYYIILSFPLLVIVPFGAFRSLAAEREDRTYELLSITALRPRQIVAGKLAAAVLQMLVYLSAISPCLAFTYLLRGIDIPTIAIVVVYTCLASLAFSLLSLVLATATTEKYQQVAVFVALLFALFFGWYLGCVAAYGILEFGDMAFDSTEFWIANLAGLTGYLSYMAFAFQAATAALSFASSNRSTGLRTIALVQQALFAAWMGFAWLQFPAEYVVLTFLILSLAHWYLMGACMTGESQGLSPRVKRDLPQSFLGRAFLTWFNPGPTTGYMFAVVSFAAAALLACGATAIGAIADLQPGFGATPVNYLSKVIYFSILGTSYLAAYLGLARPFLTASHRVVSVGLMYRLVVHGILLFAGTIVPWVIQLMLEDMRDFGYSLLQVTNPFWTLYEVGDKATMPVDLHVALIVVPLAGGIIFLLNLPAVIRELAEVRIARPQRVMEEDAELAAERAPSVPVKTNPWD